MSETAPDPAADAFHRLTDLDPTADADIARLLQALADDDAADLPTLPAGAHRHLDRHPDLAARIGVGRGAGPDGGTPSRSGTI
jgi:hypothetical protein